MNDFMEMDSSRGQALLTTLLAPMVEPLPDPYAAYNSNPAPRLELQPQTTTVNCNFNVTFLPLGRWVRCARRRGRGYHLQWQREWWGHQRYDFWYLMCPEPVTTSPEHITTSPEHITTSPEYITNLTRTHTCPVHLPGSSERCRGQVSRTSTSSRRNGPRICRSY